MSTCEWKVPVAISAVTLVLHALLLLTLYIMLSRKIASHSCSKPESSSPTEQPQQPPASAVGGEVLQRPGYEGSSDTSSETSEDSGSGSSCPQGPCSGDLNYTSLVFPGKGHGPGSTTDYVNVDPKKRKADFWPCSSPVAAKCMEYTEVKL
ncbi:regulator of hemoglobinization and erythroid cell expansion protein isoform 1-T1 [Guaruba guarouba]